MELSLDKDITHCDLNELYPDTKTLCGKEVLMGWPFGLIALLYGITIMWFLFCLGAV